METHPKSNKVHIDIFLSRLLYQPEVYSIDSSKMIDNMLEVFNFNQFPIHEHEPLAAPDSPSTVGVHM